MRKMIAFALCAMIILSLAAPLPSLAAGEMSVVVNGVKTGNTASFVVTVTDSAESARLTAYIANYNDQGIVTKVRTEPFEVPANKTVAKQFDADISSGEARLYVWDKNQRPLCEAVSSADLVDIGAIASKKLDISGADVWASVEPEKENKAKNVVDGDLTTKWTANSVSENTPQSITLSLGGACYPEKLLLAFGEGQSRDYVFSVSLSYNGFDFAEVVPRTQSERTNDLVSYDLPPILSRFVKITVLDRIEAGANGWIQISEAEVYGRETNIDQEGDVVFTDSFDDLLSWRFSAMSEMTYTDYDPSLGRKLYADQTADPNGVPSMHLYDNVDRSGNTAGGKLTVKSVTASQTPEEQYPPSNAVDGDLSTIWTASGVTDAAPAVLELELDRTYYIQKAELCFGNSTERTYVFSLELSEDGENYTKVIDKMSSSRINGAQSFEIMQTKARYARFTFYKRTDSSDNGWIRIGEAQLFGTPDGIEGAGGILAQRSFTPPAGRADYAIDFDLFIPSKTDGGAASSFYSGFALTSGNITGGADLDHYTALQLRFEDDNGKVRVKKMTSNYFNEGSLKDLFDNTFTRDRKWHIKIYVSPLLRRSFVTISDGSVSETKMVNFSYNDDELTRGSHWTSLEVNNFVINTGAGAKCELYVSDFIFSEFSVPQYLAGSVAPANGIVRLEAIRRTSDPALSNAYYGRYVYHSGKDQYLQVKANVDPKMTRFVERTGLMGFGVSFEAVSEPGYFLVEEDDRIYLKKYDETAAFCAKATFIKTEAENLGYYTGATYSYKTYVNPEKYLYDTTSDRRLGSLKAGTVFEATNAVFYLRSEVTAHVADNFYGNSIGSQWWTNYPWKPNNPTNDNFNFSALITKNNVIVEGGELFLKATATNSWPTNTNGDTGIAYNGDYGKSWERWKGYVGVVSVPGKVFNRQSYIEGSFKQPNSPIGYWNAFWLRGRDSWPPEIDIFEFLSSKYGHSSWHTAIHGEGDKNNLLGQQRGADLTTGYHTFALDWGYDYMKFYIDGELFAYAQNHATVNYQKNMQIILNTGIGGWENEPDSTMIWDDGMRVRYIRAFQY